LVENIKKLQQPLDRDTLVTQFHTRYLGTT